MCVGQSYSSGPDRPLSQLLPDLKLNQHGFSRARYFSSANYTNMTVAGHVITAGAIRLLHGLAVFAASLSLCKKLGGYDCKTSIAEDEG